MQYDAAVKRQIVSVSKPAAHLLLQELAGEGEAVRRDAVAGARRHMQPRIEPRASQRCRRLDAELDRYHAVAVAMHQRHRRLRPRPVRRDQRTGKCQHAAHLLIERQRHVERHHRALAEAAEDRVARRDPRLRPQIDQEIDDHRPRHVGALAAKILDRPVAQRKPFEAARIAAALPRRIRRHEQHVGEIVAPLAAETNQIAAVGAIAVQQHHQLFGRLAGFGRQHRP